MNRKKLYLVVLLSVFYAISYSQNEEEIKKLRFGVDFGLDLPNKQYAQFLNGSHPFGVTRILNNQVIRPQLENRLGFPILGWEFSQQNTYNSSVYAGLYLGFDLKPNLSVVMKVDFSVVRFSTPFILQLNNPQNFTGEFERATINASEQRFLYTLGIEKKFNTKLDKLTPYTSIGGSFNYIQLEKHELIISGSIYNIMRINNVQTLNFQQIDGFGYGGFVEGGVSYLLNEKFSLALGSTFNLQRNKEYVEELTDDTAYSKEAIENAKRFLPSVNFYLRLIWN